jgi:hypothetical protein
MFISITSPNLTSFILKESQPEEPPDWLRRRVMKSFYHG